MVGLKHLKKETRIEDCSYLNKTVRHHRSSKRKKALVISPHVKWITFVVAFLRP